MLNSNRPLSPHLQIYKPQITSILSIMHRITGFALATAAIFVTLYLFSASTSVHCFEHLEKFRASMLGHVMFFGWLFSFVYHFLSGVRHIKWDSGSGIEMKSVYRSGWILILGSVILTLLLWTAVK